MKPFCRCAFFRANGQSGIFKHLVYCQAEREAEDYCVAHGLPIIANFATAPNNVEVKA